MKFQDGVVKSVYSYLTSAKAPNQLLCVIGPTGCGKSAALEFVSKALDRPLVVVDDETTLGTNPLGKSLPIYVVDEPDESLSKLVPKLLKVRAILVTCDVYSGPLSGIRAKLSQVRMNPYTDLQRIEILRQTFDVSDAVLKVVSDACLQDIRYGQRLLTYAIQTAKAKQPGHKTIVAPKDVSFDLFTDTANAFARRPTCGLQSDDFFLYTLMLQTNCILRTKKVTKVLDAFSILDVLETAKELPNEMLTHLVEASLLDPIDKPNLTMFKVPNPGKRMDLLRQASGQRSYEDCVLSCSIPRTIKGEAADVKAVRKTPYSRKE
jgi:hypothetical protein